MIGQLILLYETLCILNSIFRLPEKIRMQNGIPVVEVDWLSFYAMQEEELDRLIRGKRLLTNDEAVCTGLLACKYLIFLRFFNSASDPTLLD